MAEFGFAYVGMLGLALTMTGCGDDVQQSPTGGTGATGGNGGSGAAGGQGGAGGVGAQGGAPDTYAFDSRFAPGESSVAYTGQTTRHVLISVLTDYVGKMTGQIDADVFNPTDPATVMAALNYYYEFDGSSSGEDPLGFATTPAPMQTTFNQLAPTANLSAKMAGNDTVTDHKDWSTEFVGWTDESIAQSGGAIDSPEGLLLAYFNTLAELAVARENGVIPTEPDGDLDPDNDIPIAEVFVTAAGQDLQQLIQKFLLMGVTYSQATDDYLDSDVSDKGTLSPNTQDEDNPYSVLEHHWDEGFGYFGAARDYTAYTDGEIAMEDGRDDWQGMHDSDGDNLIDLRSEINFGASVNAGKRDFGAVRATDYSSAAFEAFLQGRQLISSAGDSLSSAQITELQGYAESGVAAWENAITATIIHYINETVADTEAVGTAGYSFLDHAKHWSELKGFALGLQFNPRSRLSDTDFSALHVLIGDRPVLANSTPQERADYASDLLAARDILALAYGFDAANVEGW